MIDFVTILVNLLLVSIILFIYRQYDKRSRALEKIKKFIDIAKDNLEDFIDDKTKEINNLAVDMEAYQRSSLEIIKKIDEVQQKIKIKSNDFVEVEKKIAYHDSILKELDDMALKVQDNIERLQVDGKIVDKLSKTLKGFHSQIDSVDSRLNDVFSKFDDKNKENLEIIKTEIWNKFNDNINEIDYRVKSLNNEVNTYEKALFNIEERKRDLLDKGNEKVDQDLSDFISKVEENLFNYNKAIEESYLQHEEKYRNIENALDKTISNAKSQITEKESMVLAKLNEEMKARYEDMFNYIDERSNDIRDKLEDKLTLTDNEIFLMATSFKDNSYTRINSLEETIKQEIRKYEEQIANIFDRFRTQVESNVKDIYREYDNKIGQVDKDIRTRVDLSLIDANQKMENIQENIQSLLKNLESESNNIYSEFKEKVKTDIDSFNENTNDKIQGLETQLENKVLNIDMNIQEKISRIDNELYSGLKEINDRLNSNYSYLDDNINVRYKELFDLFNAKNSDLESEIELRYSKVTNILKEDIDSFSLNYNNKFSILMQETERSYQGLENNLGQISRELNENINDIKGNYNEEINNFIREMDESRAQYSSWHKELSSNLENLESQLRRANEEFLSLINIQKEKGMELSESVFNELSEHIEKKSIETYGNWKEEQLALTNRLLNIKTASEEILIKVSSKIEIYEKDASDRFDYIASKISNFENSILQKYKDLQTSSIARADEILTNVKELIGNQTEIIHSKGIELVENLNNNLISKETLVNGKIEELDYKLKDIKIEYEDLLHNFKSEIDDFIDKKSYKISEIKDEHQRQIDDFLEKVSSDIFSRRDFINEEVNARLNDWQLNLGEITSKVENLLSSGKVDIDLIDSGVTLRIKELQRTIDELENYYLDKIDEFRNQGNIYSDELLKNMITHFEKDTKDLEDNLSKRFIMVLDKSEEFVKEVDSLLKDKRTEITSFQSNIDVTLDSLSVKFNEINKEINDKYNEVTSNYRRYSETISTKLEDEITSEIEKVNVNLSEKIENIASEMEESLQKVKESFDTSKYEVEKFEIKIKDITYKEESRINEILKDIEQQYNKRREESIDYKQMIDNDINQVKQRFGEIINEIRENIENKSDSLNDLYKERFKLVETNLENRYSSFLIEKEGAISKIRDEIYKILTENDEKLRIKMLEMDQNFEVIDQRSREIIEFEEDIRKKIYENSNRINYQFEGIKVDIEREIKNQFETYTKKAIDLINQDVSRYENDIGEKISSLKSIEDTFKDIERELKDKISKYSYEFGNTVDSKYRELEEKYKEKQQITEDKINSVTSNIDTVISRKYLELEEKYSLMHDEIEKKLNKYISTIGEELNNSNSSMHKEIETQFKDLEELKLVLENVNKDVKKLKEESYQTVSSTLQILEEDFFKNFKARNEELSSSLSSMALSSDIKIKELEKSIIENIENKTGLINNFKLELEQEFIKEKEVFYQEFNKEFDSRKKDMEHKISLIEGNVTNRIDEFIIFVNNRQSTVDSWFSHIKNDVKTWQEKVYRSIEERSSMAEVGIKTIENDVSTIKNNLDYVKNNIEVRTEEIFRSLQGEIKKIESLAHLNLKNIENDFKERVITIDRLMDSKVETVDSRINEKIENMASFVEDKFISQQKDMEDKMLKVNRKLEDEFIEVISKVENEKQELVKRIFNDKDVFENRINEVKSEVLGLTSKVNAYKNELEGNIKNNYDAFVRSIREQYSLFENEVKNNFSKSDRELQKIKNSVEDQVKAMESGIKNNYETMLKDLNLNVDKLQSKISNYDEELNEFVDGIRGNLISYKEEIKDDLEKYYLSINSKLENFRRLEAELENNKSIFDDVHYLKDSVRALWESLKAEVEIAEKYKNDFKVVNKDLKNIQQEASGVLEVFNSLKAEQDGLEALKKDFERFSEFYGLFSERYKSLIESYDDMQFFKIKIKEIKDEQESVLENYERIQNKEELIKSTIKSVDKNFDAINEVEKKFNELNKERIKFKGSLDELKVVIDELLLNKDISNEALRNAQNLKYTLENIDERLNKVKEIREKVVKSETRLENLNIAAEERIKTLGILVKTDSKYKDNVGLNNETVRDSVIKLMKQGWSAEEISRATKLSVGEVELILELGMTGKND